MSAVTHVASIVVAAALGLGVTAVGGASLAAQRASAAADAAALAAADVIARVAPGAPCSQAERVAQANGATVTACTLIGRNAEVTVTTTFAGLSVSATAKAGPALAGQASGWVRPSDGAVTSGFGPRDEQCSDSYCSSTNHEGLDFATGCGAPIYAARSGTITRAGPDGGFGNHIRIDHGEGLMTGYAHALDGSLQVSVGDVVAAGELIALEGETGNSFGCHLHFEVLINGILIDPASFVL